MIIPKGAVTVRLPPLFFGRQSRMAGGPRPEGSSQRAQRRPQRPLRDRSRVGVDIVPGPFWIATYAALIGAEGGPSGPPRRTRCVRVALGCACFDEPSVAGEGSDGWATRATKGVVGRGG